MTYVEELSGGEIARRPTSPADPWDQDRVYQARNKAKWSLAAPPLMGRQAALIGLA